MPTTITFRRGASAPTQGSGITLGEPAFETTLKRLFIGQGAGVTAVWVGAQISGLSAGIAAGLTYQIPTMSAVKDYVTSATSGVSTLNSLSGALTIVGGTNIGVTASGSSITITDFGVSAAQANTFTAVQTFNSGVTLASTLDVTGAAKFNGNVTVGDAAGDVLTVTAGSTFGVTDHSGVARFASGVTVSGRLDVGGVLDVVSGTTFESTTDHAGAARFAGGATFTSSINSNNTIVFTGVGSGNINGNNGLFLSGTTSAGGFGSNQGPGQIRLSMGGVTIGSGGGSVNFYPTASDGGQGSLALWYNDTVSQFSTTITPLTPTANRTINLPNASGTVALTSQLMGAVNGSTAATTAVTSFNGLTGAVGGVCAAQANTFTAAQTFNAGITTSTLDVTGQAKFNGNVNFGDAAADVMTVTGGMTVGSSLDVTGNAKFNGNVTIGDASSDVLTVVAGSTFGVTDHSGVARFASGVTVSGRLDVGGVLDVVSGVTFESTSDHAGAARFSGGLTASRIDITGNFKVVGDAQVGDASTDALTVFAGTTFNNRTDFAGNNNFATGLTSSGDIRFSGTTTKNIVSRTATLNVSGVTSSGIAQAYNNISLGVQTTDPLILSSATGLVNITSNHPFVAVVPGFRIVTDDQDVIGPNSITIQPTTFLTAGRTLSIQDASGTIALTSQLMGAVNGSTAATTAVTSFNGLTGAVGGVCAAQANTFTAVQTFNSGVTFASTTDHTGAARFASTVTATGAITANGGLTASTLDVSGTARTTGDMTVGATLTVQGNFFVSGTITTVNRTDLNIDDKIITMGRTLGSDALADGGGLVLKGTSDRTWTWSQTRGWESSQGINVASGSGYAVNGTSVLTSTTLGSSVVNSSLTSVGTIGTGVWQGTAVGATYGGTGLTSYTIGDVIYANGTGSLAKLSTTTAGYLLSANGAGAAPEYKQLLVRDASANSIATITSGSGTLTATIQNATTSLRGVASFSSENFTVSSGSVTVTAVDGGSY
jgi:hypothetical protein